MESGVIVSRPGSGGKGLFRLALSANEAKLFMLLTPLFGWSNTPAAAGDITENDKLILRSSAAFSRPESEVRLEIEDDGL